MRKRPAWRAVDGLNSGNSIEVSKKILRDRARPPDDAAKDRLAAHAHRQGDFGVDYLCERLVAEIEEIAAMDAAAQGAPKNATWRGAVGEDRRTPLHAEHIAACILWSDVAEAVGRERAIGLPIAERDHRDTVVRDRRDFSGKLGIDSGEKLRLRISGAREDHRIGRDSIGIGVDKPACARACDP